MRVVCERLRLVLAYDGSSFSGWQSQPGGVGVQDYLESALQVLCDRPIRIHGAGRTDAGVHALGQVAHADVPAGRFPLTTWTAALNANLPRAVRILDVTLAGPDFHARFSASGKVYRYRIWNGRFHHPLELGRSWHVPGELSESRLEQVSQKIVGTHDFRGFAANRGAVEPDTVREILSVTVRRDDELVELEYRGNGFLYRMVRLLTASLLQVARGKLPEAWLDQLLCSPGEEKTNHCAPAEGLYLVRVEYPDP